MKLTVNIETVQTKPLNQRRFKEVVLRVVLGQDLTAQRVESGETFKIEIFFHKGKHFYRDTAETGANEDLQGYTKVIGSQ
jgi:hypothetical protein